MTEPVARERMEQALRAALDLQGGECSDHLISTSEGPKIIHDPGIYWFRGGQQIDISALAAAAALEASHHAELVEECDAYRIAYEEDEDKLEEALRVLWDCRADYEALSVLKEDHGPRKLEIVRARLQQLDTLLAKIGGEACSKQHKPDICDNTHGGDQ